MAETNEFDTYTKPWGDIIDVPATEVTLDHVMKMLSGEVNEES